MRDKKTPGHQLYKELIKDNSKVELDEICSTGLDVDLCTDTCKVH